MGKVRYCVAQVSILCGKPDVTFYAYQDGPYGIHRVQDWGDPNVLWYDSAEEALGHKYNYNDCVLSRFWG